MLCYFAWLIFQAPILLFRKKICCFFRYEKKKLSFFFFFLADAESAMAEKIFSHGSIGHVRSYPYFYLIFIRINFFLSTEFRYRDVTSNLQIVFFYVYVFKVSIITRHFGQRDFFPTPTFWRHRSGRFRWFDEFRSCLRLSVSFSFLLSRSSIREIIAILFFSSLKVSLSSS